MTQPLVIVLVAALVGLALIGVPIWAYYKDKIDKEMVVTILIGELTLLTLGQLVLAIVRVS